MNPGLFLGASFDGMLGVEEWAEVEWAADNTISGWAVSGDEQLGVCCGGMSRGGRMSRGQRHLRMSSEQVWVELCLVVIASWTGRAAVRVDAVVRRAHVPREVVLQRERLAAPLARVLPARRGGVGGARGGGAWRAAVLAPRCWELEHKHTSQSVS
jgi:hypothetical protein